MEHKCLSPWKGAVIGGLIAFAWSAVSWMALPFHNKTVRMVAAPEAVAAALGGGESGVYIGMNDPAGKTAPKAPFVFVSYSTAGWGGMGVSMLLGLLAQGVGGFFWTWILGKIPGLTARDAALYGAFFGLCLGALGAAPNSIWWKFPWPFTLLYALDGVIAWTIASVAIARFGQAAVCALPPR